MQIPLVLTVIGKDRPGLVELVAQIIVNHKGNWLESRMCRLGGEFAGILRIQVPPETEKDLSDALNKLADTGITVVIRKDLSDKEETPSTIACREVVGQDRPGIVYQISNILAKYNVNVEELTTEYNSAPMSGESLFVATARLKIPASCNINKLREDLEKIGNDLMVDTILQPGL